MKNLSQDSQWPGSDVNQAPVKHKSIALPLDQPVQFEFVSMMCITKIVSYNCPSTLATIFYICKFIRCHSFSYSWIYPMVSPIYCVLAWSFIFSEMELKLAD
jgi:hypothetical protein